MVVTESMIDLILDELEDRLDYIGIGTGAAPAASDTALASEATRKATTYLRDVDTTVIEGYWESSEGNGVSYTNAGIFIDGNATPGTGTLAGGGAISVAKTAAISLTVSIEITVEAV